MEHQQTTNKPEWQMHIDWAIHNWDAMGSVDCPDKYLSTYPECYFVGGRACLMRKAIQSAKDGDYANAFRLTLITQCHNVPVRDKIQAVGQQAVGDYLKTWAEVYDSYLNAVRQRKAA